MQSQREKSKNLRRQKIIEAARTLIEQREDTNFTMQDLALEAGVSLATPYNLFGSKNLVILGVLGEVHQKFQANLARTRQDELGTIFAATTVAKRIYEKKEGFYRAIFQQLSYDLYKRDAVWNMLPARNTYRDLVDNANKANVFRKDVSMSVLSRNLGYIFSAVRRDWISEFISLDIMEPRVKSGQAMLLLSAVRHKHRARVMEHLAADDRVDSDH